MSSIDKNYPNYIQGLKDVLNSGPESMPEGMADLLEMLEHFAASELEHLETVLQVLATGVGAQKSWQDPFRENGILSFTLEQLRKNSHNSSLARQCLRTIGNCVSDNDLNREVVTQELGSLLRCLTVEELELTTLIVLFNLSNGFDPAKAALATSRLDTDISIRLVEGRIPEAAMDHVVDLLTWTTEMLKAEQFKDSQSLTLFENLLKVALQYDEDHHEEYVAILVHYLQDPEFQQMVATPTILEDLFALILDFEGRISPEELEETFKDLAITKTEGGSATIHTSAILLSQLISSTSGISATDTFASTFSVTSQIVERIRASLRVVQEKPSDICAYVILGNLAMSDEVCTNMVKVMNLHEPLGATLSSSEHPAILYAAAGLMRHLAFPEANREILADSGLLQTCCYLLFLSDPSVRGEAAAIMHKLATNNLHNIKKTVYDQFAHLSTTVKVSRVAGSTLLENIVEQALVASAPLPSTAMKNPMIELGRTIVTMLRHLGHLGTGEDIESVRQKMSVIPRIARPLAGLVRQRFYPEARSEGLLGLGLLSQSPQGASRVVEELQADSGLLNAIKELAEGSPEENQHQPGSSSDRDYQNAAILLQALQNNGEGMDADLKGQVDDVQGSLRKSVIGDTET